MPAQNLELEITENVVMHDSLNVVETLQALRVLGVRTAVADFGKDNGDAAIVEASISLGHKLGLEIVAEGVESREQLNFLRDHDCDLAQGYYLSHPLSYAEFMESLQRPRRGNGKRGH